MAATPSGQRRWRIEFTRGTLTRGAMGAFSEPATWTSLGFARAKVLYGTGAERRESAIEAGTQTATFRCLLGTITRTITVRDRINHAGVSWDITAIAPLGGTPAEIEFTAVASRG